MDQEKTPPHLRHYFIAPDEFRLRAGWRLMVHSLLLIFSIMLISSFIAIGMVLFGIQPETIFEGVSPLLDVIVSLPTFSITTFIVRRFIDRRSFTSLGFEINSRTVQDIVVGFAIPGLLMGAIFLFEWSVGWLTVIEYTWEALPLAAWLPDLLIWIIVYIAVGYQEELLSRGYHLQNIAEGLNLPLGILISSVIFALLHLGNPFASLASFVGLIAAGYFLAFAWLRTRQLWLSIGLHIGWNFFEGNIFGFPVSGTETFKIIRHEVTGPTLITGGDFGPEAGLVLLPALLLGTILIYRYTNRVEGSKTSKIKSTSS